MRKAAITLVMSVRPYGATHLPLDGFLWNLIWIFHEILSRKFNLHWNLTRIDGILREDLWTYIIISRSVLLRLRNASDIISRKIKTYILCSTTFFSENRAFWWDKVVKPDRPHTAHAHCMLCNYGYGSTLRICNTYCFSMATMVTRIRLNVKWYVPCLSYTFDFLFRKSCRLWDNMGKYGMAEGPDRPHVTI